MRDYMKKQLEDAKKFPVQWILLVAAVGLIIFLSSCSTKDEEDPFLAEVESMVEQEKHTRN